MTAMTTSASAPDTIVPVFKPYVFYNLYEKNLKEYWISSKVLSPEPHEYPHRCLEGLCLVAELNGKHYVLNRYYGNVFTVLHSLKWNVANRDITGNVAKDAKVDFNYRWAFSQATGSYKVTFGSTNVALMSQNWLLELAT